MVLSLVLINREQVQKVLGWYWCVLWWDDVSVAAVEVAMMRVRWFW